MIQPCVYCNNPTLHLAAKLLNLTNYRCWRFPNSTTTFDEERNSDNVLKCVALLSSTNTFYLFCLIFKASAHSFKQFTSRLLKLTFSLSMHLYNSDGRHAWFHLHGTIRPARSTSEATKYKMKNPLSTVGLDPTTLRFQVWCSTDWPSRAWWMLSI